MALILWAGFFAPEFIGPFTVSKCLFFFFSEASRFSKSSTHRAHLYVGPPPKPLHLQGSSMVALCVVKRLLTVHRRGSGNLLLAACEKDDPEEKFCRLGNRPMDLHHPSPWQTSCHLILHFLQFLSLGNCLMWVCCRKCQYFFSLFFFLTIQM